eukprot:m.213862 g.213862  ORF g.213862 m.213862 type:complete len:488 (+) comp33161_c0_seq1:167-1630(+)
MPRITYNNQFFRSIAASGGPRLSIIRSFAKVLIVVCVGYLLMVNLSPALSNSLTLTEEAAPSQNFDELEVDSPPADTSTSVRADTQAAKLTAPAQAKTEETKVVEPVVDSAPAADKRGVDISQMSFEERVEHFLPKKDFLMPDEVDAIEDKIFAFNVPRPISLRLISDYIPIEWFRESGIKTGPLRATCDNCKLKLASEMPNGYKFDATWHTGCPSKAARPSEPQYTLCGCGEASIGTGGTYFRSRKQSNMCEHHASYKSEDDFWTTYSNMHFLPQKENVTRISDEMRHILAPITNADERRTFVAMHANCQGSSGRGTILSGIREEKLIDFDSYGNCWKSHDIKKFEPDKANWHWLDSQGNRDTTKTDVITNYLFSASMENTIDSDYVTEKRYQTLVANAIPVVFKRSDPESKKYLPHPESAIFPEDFDNSPTKLAEHMKKLKENPEMLKQQQLWKQEGITREFVRVLFHSSDYLPCRFCEFMATTK